MAELGVSRTCEPGSAMGRVQISPAYTYYVPPPALCLHFLPFPSQFLNSVHNILFLWVALIKGKQTIISGTSYTANDSPHGKSQRGAIQ